MSEKGKSSKNNILVKEGVSHLYLGERFMSFAILAGGLGLLTVSEYQE